jgi:hypothetical protein
MLNYFSFVASTTGRLTRMGLGLLLLLWAAVGLDGTGKGAVAVSGLVSFCAGLFDYCLLAPLAGWPARGGALRLRLRRVWRQMMHGPTIQS